MIKNHQLNGKNHHFNIKTTICRYVPKVSPWVFHSFSSPRTQSSRTANSAQHQRQSFRRRKQRRRGKASFVVGDAAQEVVPQSKNHKKAWGKWGFHGIYSWFMIAKLMVYNSNLTLGEWVYSWDWCNGKLPGKPHVSWKNISCWFSLHKPTHWSNLARIIGCIHVYTKTIYW